MDPGREVAVESHVADQQAFIANLCKRLEAPDEQPASTSTSAQGAQVAQVPAAGAAGEPTDAEQSWEPEDATTAAENASRQSVHVRCVPGVQCKLISLHAL